MMLSGELLNDMAEHRMPAGDSLSPSLRRCIPGSTKGGRGELISRSQVLTGISEPHICLIQLHFKLTPSSSRNPGTSQRERDTARSPSLKYSPTFTLHFALGRGERKV